MNQHIVSYRGTGSSEDFARPFKKFQPNLDWRTFTSIEDFSLETTLLVLFFPEQETLIATARVVRERNYSKAITLLTTEGVGILKREYVDELKELQIPKKYVFMAFDFIERPLPKALQAYLSK